MVYVNGEFIFTFLPVNYSNFTIMENDSVEYDELDEEGKIVKHKRWELNDNGEYVEKK
jgi:hypothetical protein